MHDWRQRLCGKRVKLRNCLSCVERCGTVHVLELGTSPCFTEEAADKTCENHQYNGWQTVPTSQNIGASPLQRQKIQYIDIIAVYPGNTKSVNTFVGKYGACECRNMRYVQYPLSAAAPAVLTVLVQSQLHAHTVTAVWALRIVIHLTNLRAECSLSSYTSWGFPPLHSQVCFSFLASRTLYILSQDIFHS
jgi:hypothetical protein